jgi:hypothetical protein
MLKAPSDPLSVLPDLAAIQRKVIAAKVQAKPKLQGLLNDFAAKLGEMSAVAGLFDETLAEMRVYTKGKCALSYFDELGDEHRSAALRLKVEGGTVVLQAEAPWNRWTTLPVEPSGPQPEQGARLSSANHPDDVEAALKSLFAGIERKMRAQLEELKNA